MICRRAIPWVLSVAALASACGESETLTAHDCAADHTPLSQRHQELAHAGGWAPPAELLARADGYNIENVQASGCTGSFTEGANTLKEWIYGNWPQVWHVGGYACRKIANSDSWSVHSTGRALDLHIEVDPNQPRDDSADNDLGDPLANWLLEHAEEIGLQGIIWDNMSWYSSRPPGDRFRVYTNSHKHHDHLHIEINPEAARLGLPWYTGEQEPPDLGPCGEPLPPEGGIIDDTDTCFSAFGNAEYWRTVEGEGNAGSLRWTNAFESDSPSNWARWNIELTEGGRYRVEYYHVAEWALFDSTRYTIKYGEMEEELFIDQSAGETGWQLLGEYEFNEGRGQHVSVYDNSPVAVADGQHIIADAIRLVRVDGETGAPPTMEPPAEGGQPTPGQTASPGAEPDPQPTEDEDAGPNVVRGKGGCTVAGGSRDTNAGWIMLIVAGLLTRRRQR